MRRWLLAVACLLWLWPLAARAQQNLLDDSGQRVEFSRPFSRIISLYPAHSENLRALGLDQEIVGVGPGDQDLPGLAGRPVFSYHDDPERFLAAQPDLVLIRPMVERGYAKLVERLRASGIVVVSLQPHTVEQMYEYWRTLGRLTGREPQAEQMIRDFAARVELLRGRVAKVPLERRPRVFFESIHSKMKTFAPDSMAIFALQAAGGVNAAADAQAARGTNIAEYGKERILSLAHGIDVYLAQQGAMNKVSVQDILEESGFRAIKAVEQGRVHLVEEDLVSRPTLRLLEGIAYIQSLLYPDLPREVVP